VFRYLLLQIGGAIPLREFSRIRELVCTIPELVEGPETLPELVEGQHNSSK
jgi:hypothetical protein